MFVCGPSCTLLIICNISFVTNGTLKASPCQNGSNQEHILFLVNSNGNGHLSQLMNIMQMPKYSNNCLISVAWDTDYIPKESAEIDHTRMENILFVSDVHLTFNNIGKIKVFDTIFNSMGPLASLRVYC